MTRMGAGPNLWEMWALLMVGTLLLPLRCVWAESGSNVPRDELILEVRPEKSRVFLHERTPVIVTLLVGQVSVRNIQYPRLSGVVFMTSEFASPHRKSITRNGHEYTAYEFATTLTPRRSGKTELGPAELSCDLLAPSGGATDFFGGNESQSTTIRSEPVSFTILPLPTRGQPANFTGVVGRLAVSRTVTPKEIQSGDPVMVTTRIEGVGDFDSFPCPSISLPGVRSYPARGWRTESSLTCEQALILQTDSIKEIPAFSISFFDPLRERYGTAKSQPVPLKFKIRTPSPVGDKARASAVIMPLAPRQSNWLLMAVFAGVFVVTAGAISRAKWRQRNVNDHPAEIAPALHRYLAEAEAALLENDAKRFYLAAFRLLQASAAAYECLPSAGLTGDGFNVDLSRGDARDPASTSYPDLFRECDAVRYGKAARSCQDMLRTFNNLRELVAYHK